MDTLKLDVATIKNMLFTKFSQALITGTEAVIAESREEWPTLSEAGMVSQTQHKHIKLSSCVAPQLFPSSVLIVMNTAWNHKQNGGVGAPTTFFVEPNTIIPNFTPIFSPAIRTTSQVDMGVRPGVNQMGDSAIFCNTHSSDHSRI